MRTCLLAASASACIKKKRTCKETSCRSCFFAPFSFPCCVCVLFFLSVQLSNDMSCLGISGLGFHFHVSTNGKKKKNVCAHAHKLCESGLTASFSFCSERLRCGQTTRTSRRPLQRHVSPRAFQHHPPQSPSASTPPPHRPHQAASMQLVGNCLVQQRMNISRNRSFIPPDV